jgi:hypothetical protein
VSKRGRHDPNAKKLPFMMDGPFVARPLPMLESPAFWALSFAAHRFLIRLEIEHQRHAGKENGRLIVTYDQFAQWMHRNSVAAAQRECCALGFVEVTEQGRGGPFKRPNRYRLTYQNVVGHGVYAAASNEWRTIKTCEEAQAIAAKARSRGTITVTPRKQKAGPKNDTPPDTVTVTPSPPSPDTIAVTPSGHNYCDSLLYLQRGQPEPSLGGVPVGRGAQPPERHPEPEPCERSEQTGQATSADGAPPTMAAAPPRPPAAQLLGHLLKYGMRVDRRWGLTPEHVTDAELRHLFMLLSGSGKGLTIGDSARQDAANGDRLCLLCCKLVDNAPDILAKADYAKDLARLIRRGAILAEEARDRHAAGRDA